ncbi:hypothetical protein [Nocardia goodfellowii]|uniref:DUF5709 domain-containing protein n=1 Tax=Nocardia goodfellowii TaxID=882446 RepID=A0ABS4QGT2_9NOCA|nr:hypothetical protein [Nocardia goodfellowii]MBP2190892.1 hypothetical protein [Nocardia goodfellowii]
MTDPNSTYDPPQDTGAPDAVETDPAALSSAEDLDEDRLRQDPQEGGIEPPEHWTGVDKYGMTPWEQAHPQPLEERLAEEEPDVIADIEPRDPDVDEPDRLDIDPAATELATSSYEEDLGISADVAGGSVSQQIREPEPPE